MNNTEIGGDLHPRIAGALGWELEDPLLLCEQTTSPPWPGSPHLGCDQVSVRIWGAAQRSASQPGLGACPGPSVIEIPLPCQQETKIRCRREANAGSWELQHLAHKSFGVYLLPSTPGLPEGHLWAWERLVSSTYSTKSRVPRSPLKKKKKKKSPALVAEHWPPASFLSSSPQI